MAGAGKTVNVRKAAKAVLLRNHDGHYDEALARAEALVLAHPESVIALRVAGDLHLAAAKRAFAVFELGGDGAHEAAQEAEAHLSSARHVLSTAKQLVPDCVDLAIAVGNVLADSTMYCDAEVEYNRALTIPQPIDPAEHNAAYGLFGRLRSTVSTRVHEAKERANFCYDSLTKKLIDIGANNALAKSEGTAAVMALLQKNPEAAAEDIQKAKRRAAMEARNDAVAIAHRFPQSARAQYLHGYMDLSLVRRLDPAVDKRTVLQRSTLPILDRAVVRFPNSVVIACFRAKLHFILGDYDAAESDCHLGMFMQNADDPADDCIPPDSIRGPNRGARLVSHGSQFYEVLNKIGMAAKDYWISMTEEKRREFFSVRIDDLLEDKIDQFNISDVKSFDSDQRDIICFKETDNMFECLFHVPSSGGRPRPFDKSLENKRSRGTTLLENIKHKMKTLITDEDSTEFAKALPGIHELWLEFVNICVVDYRGPILSRSRLFLWGKLKKCMIDDPEISAKRISVADIDEMLAIVAHNPGDQEKTKVHKSSPSDHTPKINENNQERLQISSFCSDFHAEDKSFGTLNIELQDPPTSRNENGNKLVEQVGKLLIDPSSDRSSATQCITCLESQSSMSNENSASFMSAAQSFVITSQSHKTESSVQSHEETTSISIFQKCVDVLNQNSEDIFFSHFIIQTLWNLRPFRDDFLKRPPACFQSSHDGSCVADLLYEIFSACEKNDQQRIAYSLTSLKISLCKIVNDNDIFQKLRAGKSFAYEILAIVLKGLHMSEASLHFCFDDKIQGKVANPIICEDCICRVHDLFGMRFLVQMSCRCGERFDEKEYTTVFHKLDVGSPQTTKIKSLADLPVLMGEQLCYDAKCQSCGNLKNIDHFLLNTPHFFTIVLNCVDGSESHISLSEILIGRSPLDITLLHKGVDPATKYALTSMICYSDGRYVCISRDQNKWVIYGTKTIEVEEDSWERVLQRLTDVELRPEVLFFELTKVRNKSVIAFTILAE
ncbi:hypothetical protein ABZP36_008650 [Zizania latifolia]